MEHKPFVDLQAVADLKQEYRGLTRLERLARWAELLESQPDRELSPLREIEWTGATRTPGCSGRQLAFDRGL